MSQTVDRPVATPDMRDILTRRYDEAYEAWTRQEAVVEAMRGSLDTGPGDDVDAATTRAQMEEQVILAGGLRVQLDELATAAERAESGTYGHCQDCGKAIPTERLELFPAATHCVACKHLAERR